MPAEPMISKEGKIGYAFYSDRLVVFKRGLIFHEIYYNEVDHMRYCSKFNFPAILWAFANPSHAVFSPITKNSLYIISKDRKHDVMLRLSDGDFEKIKGIVNVPVEIDSRPLLDADMIAYRARHGAAFYTMAAVSLTIMTILLTVAFVYDLLMVFYFAIMAPLFPIAMTVSISGNDAVRYRFNDRSLLVSSLIQYEKIDYLTIRSVRIVQSKGRLRKSIFVRCVIITFNKRCGREIYRDVDLKLFPRDAEEFISHLKMRIPYVRMVTSDKV